MQVLMQNVFWSLGSAKRKDSYEEFIAEVSGYNNELFAGLSKWDPDEVIFDGPQLRIVHLAYSRNENNRLEVIVEAKNGKNITMGEALFSIHNKSVGFFEGVSTYFEGLTLKSNQDGVPTYTLWTGS
jgi:hypothetical protein